MIDGLITYCRYGSFFVYIDAKGFAARDLRDSSLSFREIVCRTMDLKCQNKLTREAIMPNSSFCPGFFKVFIERLYKFHERRGFYDKGE